MGTDHTAYPTSVSVPSSAWMRRLKELAAFKKEYGHCLVSILDKKHATLGNWVRIQRGKKRKGMLTKEQIRRLDALGFVWEARLGRGGHEPQELWENLLTALVEYKKVHGNCDIPIHKNPRLTNWMSRQRYFQQKGTLPPEREERLSAIGFHW